MNTVSLILTALLTLALVVLIAPNILAMNRGKTLRNIALWLAIFASLALIYQKFGPGSKAPMFNMPAAMAPQNLVPPSTSKPAEDKAPDTSL
jgi:hypothetical protein